MSSCVLGNTVAQWLALPPRSKKVVGLILCKSGQEAARCAHQLQLSLGGASPREWLVRQNHFMLLVSVVQYQGVLAGGKRHGAAKRGIKGKMAQTHAETLNEKACKKRIKSTYTCAPANKARNR